MGMQVASIYVREKDVPGVRWLDGPYPLARAQELIAELAGDEVEIELFRSDVLYFELRGLNGCSVRYRLWIVQPDPFVRTEVLAGRSPGGHTARSVRENK